MYIRSFLTADKTFNTVTIKGLSSTGASSSTGALTKITLSQVQRLKNSLNFITYFRSGKMRFDFSYERKFVSNLKINVNNVVYLDKVSSIAGDGTTDDTEALRDVLESAKGYVVGNKNKTYLVNTTDYIAPAGLGLVNVNIKNTTPTKLLNLKGGKNNYIIHNCSFNGGRGSFTETWQYFSDYSGEESCQPALSNYIQSIGNRGRIVIRKSTFSNIFARKVLAIGSKDTGVVFYKDLKFKNVASRTFHGWNDEDTNTGVQYAFDITADGAGILPSSFRYKNPSGSTVTMSRSSSDCPYPQNSFGNIVSFGTFIASNIQGDDMASCGIGLDRNKLAIVNDISIDCNNSRLKTNNPYGAFWNEYSKTVFANGIKITIESRGDDVGDSSLLELCGMDGSVCEVRDVTISTDKQFKKAVRVSSKGGAKWGLTKLRVSDPTEAIGLAHGYLSSASNKDKYLHLTRNSNLNVYRLRLQPVNDLLIQQSIIDHNKSEILSYDSGVSGISNLQGRVRINNTQVRGNLTIAHPIKELVFNKNTVSGNLTVNCDINKASIEDNNISGSTSINRSRISSLST